MYDMVEIHSRKPLRYVIITYNKSTALAASYIHLAVTP